MAQAMLLTLVVACFTLSGFAALLYQIAWMRLFSIAFGTSEIAVAVVLAGYMAGLASGAAIAARYVGRIRRPVLVYGILEGAIAISALAMPLLVDLSGDLYAWVVGNQAAPPNATTFGQSLYYSAASFIVLLIPTALMGATLPLLAQYAVTANRNLGSRVSLLYSMNTFGAVGGTLVAGFVLLPAIGLRGTVWVGVLTNGVVFLLAVWLARYLTGARVEDRSERQGNDVSRSAKFGSVLPLIALSGALSFIYEVLWTRMLSHVLGSSVYAFATMLSAFLAGIAIGAAGAGLVAKNPRRAIGIFGVCQFGTALASAFVYWRIEQSVPSGLSYAVFAFAAILPSSIFIGATYPLAVRAYAGNVADVGRSSALVYSWNTVGAIVGALVGGFVVIPALGFAGTAHVAVIANLCIGMVAFAVLLRADGWTSRYRLKLSGAGLVFLAVAILFQPGRPDALITRAHFGGSGEQTIQEIYYSVGRSSTVLMTENAARFDLSTNGLPEAQIEFKGAPPMILSQRWLGLWPSLARPYAKSVLVVGLGGGVVLEGIPESIETLHVVELEADVVAANELIGDRRSPNPLAREGLHLVVNDARNALRLTSTRYDAIVSQPSHPWTSGASHLFTREFFALVKSRLHADGVFVQWMNAEFLDETLLRRFVATLLAEFENVRIYQPSALALHFIASDGPIDIERQLAATGKPLHDDPQHYGRNGISAPVDVFATLLADQEGVRSLAADLEPITDEDNRMAVDTNMRATGLGIDALSRLMADVDPLLNVDGELRRTLSGDELVFVARRLLYDGQYQRATQLRNSMSQLSMRNMLQAMLMRYDGRGYEATGLLENIAAGDELYQQAVFLQIEDALAAMQQLDHDKGVLADFDMQGSRLGAVLLGWRALDAENWQALFELEARLRMTRSSDLWAPYAALLRAEWRLRLADNNHDLAREALAIIDRAVARGATRVGYAQRARAGQILEENPALIESVAFLVRSMNDRLWNLDYYGQALPANEKRWLKGQLDNFEAALRRPIELNENGRAATVLSQLLELRKSLLIY